MSEKALLTQGDCLKTGDDIFIDKKVIILHSSALSENCREAKHQVYFCIGGNGSNPNPIGSSIFAVSLADGEHIRWNRSDVLGIAKPEILTDHARLQLSQIRPAGAVDLKNYEPQYSGYCFLPNGRYTSGVWLCSPQEVEDYIGMQKEYQHRIMICDRDDFCVFEMVDGQIVHPSMESIEAFQKGQQEQDGMDMKL
ncbi:hypothetical protein [Tissierella praeacuta]|uniref:hypothetical protein n=1 Tax=Tissierella praeacuta TaxID=43131 RepID=UPI003340A7D5